jgi:hypothetical protein
VGTSSQQSRRAAPGEQSCGAAADGACAGSAQKYDVLQFKVGPALESGIIPVVLAPIWLLYGYLQPLVDTAFKNDPATKVLPVRGSPAGCVWRPVALPADTGACMAYAKQCLP